MQSIPNRPPDFPFHFYRHVLDGYQLEDHFVIRGDLKDGKEVTYSEMGVFSERKYGKEVRETFLRAIASHSVSDKHLRSN